MAIGRISGQMLKANLLRSGTDLAFETNLLVLDVTNSFVGIGTATPARQLHISGTGALRLPSGTTEQRGTPANGDIRYNSTLNAIEGYANGAFVNLGSGTQLIDADGNTGIDVERAADQNEIHFFTEAAGDVAHIRADGDIELNNLEISNQTITGLTTNANITLTPNGTGSVAIGKADINGGTIDGTVIGGGSAAAATFTSLTTSGGTVTLGGSTTGSIDNVNIGATTQGTGKFTALESTGNMTVGGNLTVNGTTTTIESTTLQIEDPILTLAKNSSSGQANNFDQGLVISRGSENNQFIGFDESANEFAVFETADSTPSGNVTVTAYSPFHGSVLRGESSVDTGAIKALDGSAAATIAQSTGVITIGSSVLTTADINGGTADNVVIGGSTAAAGTFTTVSANDHIAITADSKELRIGAGTDFTITHNGTNTIIDNNTGILQIEGFATSSIRINEAGANVDTVIEGDTDDNLFFVDASADKIGISTSTPNYIMDFGGSGTGSTDAIRLPQGNIAARPTAATGIIRFNTETGSYEGSVDGSSFVTFALGTGGVAAITKLSATGDGSTTTFSGFFSSAPATAANAMVFIDNVHQEPTENYTVSGSNITFTSAPHTGARIYALEGFDAGSMTTGGVARQQTGSVAFTSAATSIFDFNAATYRSAEAFVTITDTPNGEYSCMKIHVVHDGTDPYISVYGVTNTGGSDTATFTTTLSSGTVSVLATSTGGASSALVQYSVQAV